MAYSVIVLPSAEADMTEHAELIAQDSLKQAIRWLNGAWSLINSLQEMPKRYALIPESTFLGVELRDVVHFSHRIVYQVFESENRVEITRVWHLSRREMNERDLP